MISLHQGKPHFFYQLGSALFPCLSTEGYPALDDPAITAGELWLWHQPSLSYAVQLQREVHSLREQLTSTREQLAAKECELAEVLSGLREDTRVITLPLDIETSFPARIIEEIEAPFYFSGNEPED